MSFLLLEINLLLKFDFLLKYEAYPIKWTSDTWCFAGPYLTCGSFQRLRWSTAVWCRWRNLKPVHLIRKILWKTESVMIGKIVTFWRVKMQIWEIYDILLVNECCGTLGTAVNEAYFALFSMGVHVTGLTPYDRKRPQEVNPLLTHSASLTLRMCAHGFRQSPAFFFFFWRTSYWV